MDYKRIHVRVPISGEALLFNAKDSRIKAKAIDISQGGVAITDPSKSLTNSNYDIIITISDGQEIKLTAKLIRQTGNIVGFKTSEIDSESLKIITDLVFQYQETPDFIKQIEEHNLFEQNFIDDEGNEYDITFDLDPDTPDSDK